MIYAAIAQYPATLKVYEGRDIAELAERFARDNGGHFVLDDDAATIPVYSGKAYLSRADGQDFWWHVMSDVMSGRDNDEFFVSEKKAEATAKAQSWLDGTYGEDE